MRLSCSWSVMQNGKNGAGGWRTEDGRRRRTEGGSRAAAVEPACHMLEDGSLVADDDSRTADEEPPSTCCVNGVTRQLTHRRVSRSRSSYRKAFLQKSFITVGSFVQRTTWFVFSRMSCVKTLTTR